MKVFSVNKTEGRSSGKSFPKTDQTSFCSGARFRIVEKIFLNNEESYLQCSYFLVLLGFLW